MHYEILPLKLLQLNILLQNSVLRNSAALIFLRNQVFDAAMRRDLLNHLREVHWRDK